jgi:hypothetical protein
MLIPESYSLTRLGRQPEQPDPHRPAASIGRLQALNWWREILTTRLNDPKRAAIVVIMQRLHEEDVSGAIP